MSLFAQLKEFFSHTSSMVIVASDGESREITYLSHWQRNSPIDLDQKPIQKIQWDLFETDDNDYVAVKTDWLGTRDQTITLSRECRRFEQLSGFITCPKVMAEFSKLLEPGDPVDDPTSVIWKE